jgi:hypothetical protein
MGSRNSLGGALGRGRRGRGQFTKVYLGREGGRRHSVRACRASIAAVLGVDKAPVTTTQTALNRLKKTQAPTRCP